MRIKTYLFSLILCIVLSSSSVWAAQPIAPGEQAVQEDLAIRYDVANWDGKGGPIVAGITPGQIPGALDLDHVRWLDADGKSVLLRQFTMTDHQVTVEVAVTRTCDGAHQVLFDHLARPRTMAPLDPPALPYGSIRSDEIGDVCFALPGHRGGFHAIEFVRHNVVVLLRGEGTGMNHLKVLALAIDKAIVSQPLYRSWETSRAWPSITKFELPETTVKAGATLPVTLEITGSNNGNLMKAWEVSAGGVEEKNGTTVYYAEGSGRQTLTLLVANQRGLAASATIEFDVTK